MPTADPNAPPEDVQSPNRAPYNPAYAPNSEHNYGNFAYDENGHPNPLWIEATSPGNPNDPTSQWGNWDPSSMSINPKTGQVEYHGASNDINRYRNLADQNRNAVAPQANFTLANQYLDQAANSRNSQLAALDLERQAAYGQAPSAAQIQMQQGLGQALANQQALASSARGAGAMGVAQANAAQGAASLQAQTVGNTGALRAQEMAGARQAYLQGASGIRGQDYGGAQLQGGWELDQARLREQQNALNAQTGLGYEQLGYNVGKTQLEAGLQHEGMGLQQWQTQTGLDKAAVDRDYNTAVGAAQAGASVIGAASDERIKRDVRDAGLGASLYGARPSGLRGDPSNRPGDSGLGPSGGGLRGDPSNRPRPSLHELLSDIRKKDDITADEAKFEARGEEVERRRMDNEENRGLLALANKAREEKFMRIVNKPIPPGYVRTENVVPGPGGGQMQIATAPAVPSRMSYPAYGAGTVGGATSPAGVEPAPFAQTWQMAAQQHPPPPGLAQPAPGIATMVSDERAKRRIASAMPRHETTIAPSQIGEMGDVMSETGASREGIGNVRVYRHLGESFMSDERAKRPLSEVMKESDADRFLDHLHPYTYRYKDPADEPNSQPTGGRYLGVMAQNVERSPTGKQIVTDTPRGKVLEGGAMMSAMAAGLGRLHERMRELEGERKGKR